MFKFVRPIVVSGLCLMMPLSSSAQEQDLLFTGRVFSQQAQDLFVPLTNNWQARISMMLPEGSKVEVGDVAVEFDGSDVARELESHLLLGSMLVPFSFRILGLRMLLVCVLQVIFGIVI